MARCFCACHEYPGTYPPPCNVCGHHNDHGRYPGAVNMGWVPDGEDVGPLRIESGEKYVLREALAQIVGAFTSGIYCANCGEGVETCRCIIDLGRTALSK